jgi:hypothetical protein
LKLRRTGYVEHIMRLLRLLLVTLFETLAARRRNGPLRPSWTFQFEWVVAFLRRDFVETGAWTAQRLRNELNRRPYPSAAARRVTRRDDVIGGVPAGVQPNAIAQGGVVFRTSADNASSSRAPG